jgi:Protein of unknown function (DUF3489)
MRRLSDTQLVTLANAAAREDGAAVAPASMANATATKVATSLVDRKLMQEVQAKSGIPVWRRDREGRPWSLIITQAGRDAIGVVDEAGGVGTSVEPHHNAMEAPADAARSTRSSAAGSDSRGQRPKKSGVITASADEETTPKRTGATGDTTRSNSGHADAGREALVPGTDASAGASITSPRSGSKQALLTGLLSRPDGARLDDLIAATGWLPHTTRAALTGLRKRGYAIERTRPDDNGPSVYRIAPQPGSGA